MSFTSWKCSFNLVRASLLTDQTSNQELICRERPATIYSVVKVVLPFTKNFTLSVTKMSAKRMASQKPIFTGSFDDQNRRFIGSQHADQLAIPSNCVGPTSRMPMNKGGFRGGQNCLA